MIKETRTRQTGKARSKLLWIERYLSQIKRSFHDVTRYRIIGGAILLINLLVLSGLLMKSGQVGDIIATAGLVIGDLILIGVLMTTGEVHCSVNAFKSWQGIAADASTPDTGTENKKWEKLYLYEPLQMEPSIPGPIDHTRSGTDYCEISGSSADVKKHAALSQTSHQ